MRADDNGIERDRPPSSGTSGAYRPLDHAGFEHRDQACHYCLTARVDQALWALEEVRRLLVLLPQHERRAGRPRPKLVRTEPPVEDQ